MNFFHDLHRILDSGEVNKFEQVRLFHADQIFEPDLFAVDFPVKLTTVRQGKGEGGIALDQFGAKSKKRINKNSTPRLMDSY